MVLKPGMLVKSKAGRDKSSIYVIISVKNEYVYLADGDARPLRRPKKKNTKHLQPILKAGAAVYDSDAAIREFIRKNVPHK